MVDLTGDAGLEVVGGVLAVSVVLGAVARPRWLAWLPPGAVGIWFLIVTLREAGILPGGTSERQVGLGVLTTVSSVVVTGAAVLLGRQLTRWFRR